jgi:hypothetical protein
MMVYVVATEIENNIWHINFLVVKILGVNYNTLERFEILETGSS